MSGNGTDSVSLPIAAQRLGVSYEKAKRMLFKGEIRGENFAGRWFVSSESVDRKKREREGASQPLLTPAA